MAPITLQIGHFHTEEITLFVTLSLANQMILGSPHLGLYHQASPKHNPSKWSDLPSWISSHGKIHWRSIVRGFIGAFTSPAASGFFYVEKKDGWSETMHTLVGSMPYCNCTSSLPCSLGPICSRTAERPKCSQSDPLLRASCPPPSF